MRFAFDEIVQPHEIALLITIPLAEKRYQEDLKDGFSFLPKKPKEFARLEKLRSGRQWDGYFSNVARAIISDIEELHNSSHCVIDHDVTYRQFRRAMDSDEIKILFLFAHHIRSRRPGTCGYIEFSDGGTPVDTIHEYLRNASFSKKSLFLFVCGSDIFLPDKTLNVESLGFISSSSWNIPTVAGFGFIKQWIMQFDGNKTITEAYATAINQYLKQ